MTLAAADPARAVEAPPGRSPSAPPPRPKAPAANPGARPPRAASLVHKASFPKLAPRQQQVGCPDRRLCLPRLVGVAWSNIAKKYPALRGYSPATARFDSAKGTVYRLSVQGFESDGAARDCASLKRAGGKCFVRSVAGDAPVRLASL